MTTQTVTDGATYSLLNVDVSALGFEDALRLLLEAPRSGGRLRVHFCTVHTLVEASADPALRCLLNEDETLVAPDGMPLVWLGRVRGQRVERVCGPDTMPALLDRSRDWGYRHYFYGGAEGVADRLADRFREQFPGVQVVGAYTPPFRPLTEEEDRAVVEQINAARPDFVWVGLGSPKQDFWIAQHRAVLEAPVLLAVGAAFDFHSGARKRAPQWMQRSGTEWLHRLISEPRRLGRRYTVVNARFLYLLLASALRPGAAGECQPDGAPHSI